MFHCQLGLGVFALGTRGPSSFSYKEYCLAGRTVLCSGSLPAIMNPLRAQCQKQQQRYRPARLGRSMTVSVSATATLEKPPVEPPLPELPSMDQRVKLGINGECLTPQDWCKAIYLRSKLVTLTTWLRLWKDREARAQSCTRQRRHRGGLSSQEGRKEGRKQHHKDASHGSASLVK